MLQNNFESTPLKLDLFLLSKSHPFEFRNIELLDLSK